MARSSLRWSSSSTARVLTVLAVCGCNFFVHLCSAEVNLMEARNFVAAREMAAGGSWLIPTLNGALRIAKPPLPTWAVAGLLNLTGPTENPALLRLPAALMSTLLVFFFWGLLRELTRHQPGETTAPGRTAWLGALVLASSLLVITVGREGHWDIFANAWMVGALWALARAWHTPGPGWHWWILSGLLFGLSVLSKGPVVPYAMLLPFLIGFGVARLSPARGPVRPHRTGLVVALVVGLVVGLAWPVYLALQHTVAPAALAVARVEITSWAERHAQPFWNYWNFPVFVGIWTPVALMALAVPFARPRAGRYVPYLAALGWLLASFLLLSIVPEKKERYMLPLMPPLALLMAGLLRHLETALRENPRQWPEALLVRGWAGLLVLVFMLVPVALVVLRVPGVEPGTGLFAVAAVAFGLLAVSMGWGGFRQNQPGVLVAGSLAAMSLLLALLLPASATWTNRHADPNLRHATDLRHNPLLASRPWYTLEELNVKQIWEAGRAAPAWPRTADSLLIRPTEPIAVLTGSDVAAQLPAAWRNQVRLRVVDSFYLDRQRKDGYWRVTMVEPIR